MRIRVSKVEGAVFHTRKVSHTERWGGMDQVAVAGKEFASAETCPLGMQLRVAPSMVRGPG